LSWRLGQIKHAVVGDWNLYKIDHYTVVFLSAMRNGSYPDVRAVDMRYPTLPSKLIAINFCASMAEQGVTLEVR
jgi:hypothetical protein